MTPQQVKRLSLFGLFYAVVVFAYWYLIQPPCAFMNYQVPLFCQLPPLSGFILHSSISIALISGIGLLYSIQKGGRGGNLLHGPLAPMVGGALAGVGLTLFLFEVGLWAISQPSAAGLSGPVVMFVLVLCTVPSIVAVFVFRTKRLTLFSAAMIVASLVIAGWLLSQLYGQFGTFL